MRLPSAVRSQKKPTESNRHAGSTRTAWILLAVALVMSVLAYSPGLSTPFSFDDDLSIQKNSTIRTLDPSVALRPPGGDHAVSGRPLVNYSFALNYALNASLGIDQRADHARQDGYDWHENRDRPGERDAHVLESRSADPPGCYAQSVRP